jgi:hypothetical protein
MSSASASLPAAASAESVQDAEAAQSAIQTPQSAVARGGLRRAHLWAVIPFAIAWFAASIDVIEPFDFWWNVKSGQIMFQTGHFLSTDVLVWSPVREPYYNPQWGSQILFYFFYHISPYLLLTLRAVIITASVGLLLRICTWRSMSLRAGALATLVAYFAAWTNYGMRPQLFAFLPFVGFLYILERKDAFPRAITMLVPIMLFWVNVHGSFFLGVALLGIYSIGTLIETIGSAEGRAWLRSRTALWQAFWIAAAVAATLANPYFTGIYNYFFVATNDPIARSLNVEWQPPTLNDGTGQLFYLQVLIFAASIYFGKRRMRPTELLLILAFGYLSLTSLRNVMWWGWVTAPIMAANFVACGERWRERRNKNKELAANEDQTPSSEVIEEKGQSTEKPVLNWGIAVIMVGAALLFTPLWRQSNPLVPTPARVALSPTTPEKLATFLKNSSVPTPIFNYMEWGGYFEWALYPQYQMFIDGRFEARQVPVWKDYLSISRARVDWQQTLDKYNIRTLVLSKEFHADFIPFVSASPTWHKAYEDKQGVVFTR